VRDESTETETTCLEDYFSLATCFPMYPMGFSCPAFLGAPLKGVLKGNLGVLAAKDLDIDWRN
jgi:hypothetical protein